MKAASKADLYRKLPSVDELVHNTELASLVSREGQAAATDSARAVLARLRDEITSGRLDAGGIEIALSGIASAVERELRQSLSYSLRTVINATGVILHTNLGRAPLTASVAQHIHEVAGNYSNLEFEIDKGVRGRSCDERLRTGDYDGISYGDGPNRGYRCELRPHDEAGLRAGSPRRRGESAGRAGTGCGIGRSEAGPLSGEVGVRRERWGRPHWR